MCEVTHVKSKNPNNFAILNGEGEIIKMRIIVKSNMYTVTRFAMSYPRVRQPKSLILLLPCPFPSTLHNNSSHRSAQQYNHVQILHLSSLDPVTTTNLRYVGLIWSLLLIATYTLSEFYTTNFVVKKSHQL